MRSVFSAGLLDGFVKRDFNPFDFSIGVSAGASNLLFYQAREAGKSIQVFTDVALRKAFINYRRFLGGGHLMDLDWLFETFFRENTANIESAFSESPPIFICATRVSDGKAIFIEADADNYQSAIKASVALPYLYRNFPCYEGEAMTDGGVSDSIPIAKAISLGAKKILVIRSRPKDYFKKDTLGHRFIRWKLRQYKVLNTVMERRVELHRQSVELIRQPPSGVKIVEVCPENDFIIGRLSKNKERLIEGYQAGQALTDSVIKQWQKIHND